VAEARQGQLRGAGPASDAASRFEDEDRSSGFCERDRGSEPVGTRPDDNRV
jgi:hypothetical protein